LIIAFRRIVQHRIHFFEVLETRICAVFLPHVCWEHGFSKFSCPTFVGSTDFQNPTVQRLLGTRIFKIFLSNVCWEHGFSKFSYPTFVGSTDFQNFPVQRLLDARIFKIFVSNVCGSADLRFLPPQRFLGKEIKTELPFPTNKSGQKLNQDVSIWCVLYEIAIRKTSYKPKMIIWLLASLIFDSMRQLKNKL